MSLKEVVSKLAIAYGTDRMRVGVLTNPRLSQNMRYDASDKIASESKDPDLLRWIAEQTFTKLHYEDKLAGRIDELRLDIPLSEERLLYVTARDKLHRYIDHPDCTSAHWDGMVKSWIGKKIVEQLTPENRDALTQTFERYMTISKNLREFGLNQHERGNHRQIQALLKQEARELHNDTYYGLDVFASEEIVRRTYVEVVLGRDDYQKLVNGTDVQRTSGLYARFRVMLADGISFVPMTLISDSDEKRKTKSHEIQHHRNYVEGVCGMKNEALARIIGGGGSLASLSEEPIWNSNINFWNRFRITLALASADYELGKLDRSEHDTSFWDGLVTHLYDVPLVQFADNIKAFNDNYQRFQEVGRNCY